MQLGWATLIFQLKGQRRVDVSNLSGPISLSGTNWTVSLQRSNFLYIFFIWGYFGDQDMSGYTSYSQDLCESRCSPGAGHIFHVWKMFGVPKPIRDIWTSNGYMFLMLWFVNKEISSLQENNSRPKIPAKWEWTSHGQACYYILGDNSLRSKGCMAVWC